VRLRSPTPADAAAIAAIYNEGIAGREATFETRPRDAAEVVPWLEDGRPFLVAEDDDGAVAGFARVSAYSDRCVYEGVGEHGVYVAAAAQGRGVGRALLDHFRRAVGGQLLVGTWATAEWAIRFYRRNGFTDVGPERTAELLRRYWSIPERQIETSVVLTGPRVE
jgi:L-amino acid N-acyltransferase YncA